MKRIIKYPAIFGLFLALASCSSGDEPKKQSSIPGKEPIEHLKSVILDDNGNLRLTKAYDNAMTYMIDCDDEHNANEICSNILGDLNWGVANETYTYSDGYGSVKMDLNPNEGVFISMAFNVNSLPAFTLLLTSHEYFDNNNYKYTSVPEDERVFQCFKCGYKVTRKSKPTRTHCPGSFWMEVN